MEWPSIARQPGSVRICSTVLAPARMSPSAAAAGSAAPFFTHANPSAAFLLAHSASSAAPRTALLHLSAALPQTTFAPPSGTVLGFAHVEEPSGKYFWAEIMPGNVLAHVFIPRAPLDNLDTYKF